MSVRRLEDARITDLGAEVQHRRAQLDRAHEREAARRLGVTRSALEDWTRAGRVPVVRLSKSTTRYDPEALRRWVEQLSSTQRRRNRHGLPDDQES